MSRYLRGEEGLSIDAQEGKRVKELGCFYPGREKRKS